MLLNLLNCIYLGLVNQFDWHVKVPLSKVYSFQCPFPLKIALLKRAKPMNEVLEVSLIKPLKVNELIAQDHEHLGSKKLPL